jgi:hypothetical protein
MYEKQRALNVFNSNTLISELPESFSYAYPEIGERITEQMIQEMIIQEHIALKTIDEMYGAQTRWN